MPVVIGLGMYKIFRLVSTNFTCLSTNFYRIVICNFLGERKLKISDLVQPSLFGMYTYFVW